MNDSAGSAAPVDPAPLQARQASLRAWLAQVAAAPHRYDFYQVLRRIEAARPDLPRLGEAMRPAAEPIRIGQPADLSFAPAALHALDLDGAVPRLQQRIFGLVGPNGPLPIHLTELAHDRLHHHADPTLQRFLDLLTHRFALLFYRAWAQAQPAIGMDRQDDWDFDRRLATLVGVGSGPLADRDAAGDAAKLHFAGRLARQVRDADGLEAWCRSEFDIPLRVEQWCGHWMALAPDERTRASSRDGQRLGRGAVLGGTVWDVQHKFRIVVGPLTMPQYRRFLPGGTDLERLRALVRQWVGLEFEWDLRLVLLRKEVLPLQLGTAPTRPDGASLGRTTWLGRYRKAHDADDLCIDVERALRRRRPTHDTISAAGLPHHPQ